MDPASLSAYFLVILALLAVVLECFWFSILVFKGLLAVFVTLPRVAFPVLEFVWLQLN